MNCDDITNFVNDYFDEKLNAGQKAELEQHIIECNNCKYEFALYKNLFESIKLLPMNANAPKKLVYQIYDELTD